MAFGSTQPDGGGWQQRPPRREIDGPPEQPLPPPRSGGTTPRPAAGVVVDETYVSNLAKDSLPKDAQFREYLSWSRATLPQLAAQVVAAAQLNLPGFAADMQQWVTAMRQAETALDTKTPPSHPQPQVPPWPPLPGTGADELCQSTFDANDLALRGRKSMLGKHYHLPVAFPEIVLDPDGDQKWAFGQKLEYRQEWRHEGFTLGELISSLSLLPNEELTMEVSSWQRTRREMQEELTEEEKRQNERELKRTDEESATNEAMSNNGWSLSATGSVSYGPVSASASASATGSVQERSEQAERHVSDETTKAANQVSMRRAVRMTQTAEAGSEERTTRRIRNPNSCHTLTFNFFQIVKLYDVQLRLLNDAPTVMLPGLFPTFFTPTQPNEPPRPVPIPYWVLESFNSPAVFLTRFFEVDRDFSQDINGWGLRVRIDAARAPGSAALQLAEALIVAVKFLLELDPSIPATIAALGSLVANYFQSARAVRQRNVTTYGPGKGRSEQITTPGIYVDSLMGRCTACEAYVEATRYIDATRHHHEANRVKAETELLELERQRRVKLLEAKRYEPFDAVPPPGQPTPRP